MVSGQIKEFLDFVKQCQEDYSTALEGLKLEEKRQCDLEHMIEFEESYKERCKIGQGSINAGRHGGRIRTR